METLWQVGDACPLEGSLHVEREGRRRFGDTGATFVFVVADVLESPRRPPPLLILDHASHTSMKFEDLTRGPFDSTTELQRNVYSAYLSVPARRSRTEVFDLTGTVPLSRGGWYTLDLIGQPSVTPNDVTVKVDVPPGWRIVDGNGIKTAGGRTATARLQLNETTRLRVRLVPAEDNIWQRLVAGE